MTAHTLIVAADPAPAQALTPDKAPASAVFKATAPDAPASAGAATASSTRHDGWTPERQQTFLTLLAEGYTVETACAEVGMSVASAYAFRRRPAGAAFALGWRAALLLGRDKLADVLMSRALDGQTETLTRADGETVTRHRYDNRLAAAMLARLDRLADNPYQIPSTGAEGIEIARLIASDWDRFASLIGNEGAGSAAGLFVAARALEEAVRIDESLAEREALDAAPDPQLPQLRPPAGSGEMAEEAAQEEGDGPELGDPHECVWFDEGDEKWVTVFPPPPDYDGPEIDDYTSPFYQRDLTEAEQEVMLQRQKARADALIARDSPIRDAFFGFTPGGAPKGQGAGPPGAKQPSSPPTVMPAKAGISAESRAGAPNTRSP